MIIGIMPNETRNRIHQGSTSLTEVNMFAFISKTVSALTLTMCLVGTASSQPKQPAPLPLPPAQDTPPPNQEGTAIFLHNKAPFPILVAAVFRTNQEWKTEGFWEVKPNEKLGPIAFTDNRVVCFYAQSADRKTLWTSKDLFRTINGEKLGFFRTEMQPGLKNYTMNFNYVPPLPKDEPPQN